MVERRIEACVSASGILGQRWIDIRRGSGDLMCSDGSPFAGTAAVTSAGCTACGKAFGAVTFTRPTRQTGSHGGLFGWQDRVPFDDDGGTGRNDAAIGAPTGSSPDRYPPHATDRQTAIDTSSSSGSATVPRTAQAFSDATRRRIMFTTSFDY